MIKLKWSPKSIQDLEGIWGYIAQESEKAADYVTRRLRRRAKLLCTFPLSGSPPAELKRHDLREVICGNYRIIFRVLPNLIEIVTVHHGARQLNDDNLT